MITADLNNLELMEFRGKNKPKQHCRSTFPLLAVNGSKDSAMVYIELDPGDNLGRHTDSAEETLLVIEGSIEATIGDEQAHLTKGQFAVVPKMAPHDLRNTGSNVARIIGFFGGAANIVATFDEIWLPLETNIVDTAKATAAKQSTRT